MVAEILCSENVCPVGGSSKTTSDVFIICNVSCSSLIVTNRSWCQILKINTKAWMIDFHSKSPNFCVCGMSSML